MQIENIIINEYLENNSFITTKQAEAMGISRHILSIMAKGKKIKRVKQGVYTKNDNLIDIYYLLSLNTKKIIFSYETALYLNNYIKVEPKEISITVPQGYNVNRIKKKAKNLVFHYVNINNFDNDKEEVTTKQAEAMGISRHILSIMAKDKKIKRVKQGVYTKNDNLIDIYYLLSLNTKKIIFSFETSLYLNNYINVEPKDISITVPQGYNVNRIKKKAKNLVFHYVNIKTFEEGIKKSITKSNNEVNTYDLKRTCLDIYNRDKNTKVLKKILNNLEDKEKLKLKEILKNFKKKI